MKRNGEGTRNWQETPQKNEMGRLSLQRVYKKACGGRMAQCLMTFGVIGSIEPSSLTTPGGIMHPGLPPHTPYLGTPVVFPPGQRPVSFCIQDILQMEEKFGRFGQTFLPFAQSRAGHEVHAG